MMLRPINHYNNIIVPKKVETLDLTGEKSLITIQNSLKEGNGLGVKLSGSTQIETQLDLVTLNEKTNNLNLWDRENIDNLLTEVRLVNSRDEILVAITDQFRTNVDSVTIEYWRTLFHHTNLMEEGASKTSLENLLKKKVVGFLLISGLFPGIDFNALSIISDSLRFLDNENIIDTAREMYRSKKEVAEIELPECFTKEYSTKIEIQKGPELQKIEIPSAMLKNRSENDFSQSLDSIINMIKNMSVPNRLKTLHILLPIVFSGIATIVCSATGNHQVAKEIIKETSGESLKETAKAMLIPLFEAIGSFIKQL